MTYTKEEYEQALAEFLANGGEIQQIARGVVSETATTNFWGAPKKKKKEETVEVATESDVE